MASDFNPQIPQQLAGIYNKYQSILRGDQEHLDGRIKALLSKNEALLKEIQGGLLGGKLNYSQMKVYSEARAGAERLQAIAAKKLVRAGRTEEVDVHYVAENQESKIQRIVHEVWNSIVKVLSAAMGEGAYPL